MTMRALTLWEPWATAILAGYKHYETRSWGTQYRGLIAIHAGRRCEDDQLIAAQRRHPTFPAISSGAIIAVADLTDCRVMAAAPTPDDEYWGYFGPGRYGWELSNVRPVDPILIRGYQGLWRVPPVTATELAAEYAIANWGSEQN